LIAAISFGALVATTSVLLTNLIGLSRVSFAMANNGQLPKSMSKIHARLGTPYISILVTGVLMTILASVSDLKQTAAITSISILSTHIILHFSVVRLRKRTPDLKTFKAPLYPLIPALGIAGCIILMFSLPMEAWIVWVGFVTAVSVYYLLRKRL
jgi:APA family basic amino acid/polyamine antiporter